MSVFRDFFNDPTYDSFYDQTFDLNYPYTTTWNEWNNPSDRWTNWPSNVTDRWGNRDYGTTDRGTRRRAPIQDRIPRHVESRVMTEKEGDVVWREGVPREDISIDLRDRELIVQGESKRAATYESATSRVRERSLDLTIEQKDIEAKYENGLLEIK
ncbi:14614_t:CDS:2, partial [Racocetra fulgida]